MKERCWLPYLEKCKVCIQDLGHVLYVAVMLPRFLANHKLEKGKTFIRVFSKQYGFASHLPLEVTAGDFCGVAGTPAASRGWGVSISIWGKPMNIYKFNVTPLKNMHLTKNGILCSLQLNIQNRIQI